MFDEDRVLEAAVAANAQAPPAWSAEDGVHLFETVAKHDVAFYTSARFKVFTALNSEMKSRSRMTESSVSMTNSPVAMLEP